MDSHGKIVETSSRRKQIVITNGSPSSNKYNTDQLPEKDVNIFFRTPRGQQASQMNQSNELIERLLLQNNGKLKDAQKRFEQNIFTSTMNGQDQRSRGMFLKNLQETLHSGPTS